MTRLRRARCPVLGLAMWLACCCTLAAAQLAVPPLTARVTDLTGTLSGPQRAALEQQLADFERRKGAQVAVLLVPTTRPEAIEQYALRVAEAWKLGREDVDDGALLLVAKDDRELRIEVGYGLEGALTDATSRRIIDEVIVPYFRNGDFAGGITAGVERMLRVIDGEPLPEPQWRDAPDLDPAQALWLAVFAAFVLGGMLTSLFGRLPGAVLTGGAIGLLGWLVLRALLLAGLGALIGFVVALFARSRPGLWSNHGGWRGGGFGGGGFGGGFRGGGGGFGGGGASGRW